MAQAGPTLESLRTDLDSTLAEINKERQIALDQFSQGDVPLAEKIAKVANAVSSLSLLGAPDERSREMLRGRLAQRSDLINRTELQRKEEMRAKVNARLKELDKQEQQVVSKFNVDLGSMQAKDAADLQKVGLILEAKRTKASIEGSKAATDSRAAEERRLAAADSRKKELRAKMDRGEDLTIGEQHELVELTGQPVVTAGQQIASLAAEAQKEAFELLKQMVKDRLIDLTAEGGPQQALRFVANYVGMRTKQSAGASTGLTEEEILKLAKEYGIDIITDVEGGPPDPQDALGATGDFLGKLTGPLVDPFIGLFQEHMKDERGRYIRGVEGKRVPKVDTLIQGLPRR